MTASSTLVTSEIEYWIELKCESIKVYEWLNFTGGALYGDRLIIGHCQSLIVDEVDVVDTPPDEVV